MPDKLADILKCDLLVEDDSLRDLMFETLDLCQRPADIDIAIRKLDDRRNKFSSDIGFINKLPFCCLFLSYAFFKRESPAHAVKWARIAIDGLDQLDQVWNRSIARWLCALLYQEDRQPDDAEVYFDTAIKLMKQEIQTHKRRSRYDRATGCEDALERLFADARLLKESMRVHTPALPPAENPPSLVEVVPEPSDETEDELFQDFVNMLGGDQEQAERLINLECERTPGESRKEHIRSAKRQLLRDRE